jgi:hypothetical protein
MTNAGVRILCSFVLSLYPTSLCEHEFSGCYMERQLPCALYANHCIALWKNRRYSA